MKFPEDPLSIITVTGWPSNIPFTLIGEMFVEIDEYNTFASSCSLWTSFFFTRSGTRFCSVISGTLIIEHCLFPTSIVDNL
jgi:hypothetical protein